MGARSTICEPLDFRVNLKTGGSYSALCTVGIKVPTEAVTCDDQIEERADAQTD